MLVNKETGKALPPGATEGFLESFVEGFDSNSGTQVFDQNGQQAEGNPPSMEDDDYFKNQ